MLNLTFATPDLYALKIMYSDLESFFWCASVFGYRCCASKASYTMYYSNISFHVPKLQRLEGNFGCSLLAQKLT